MLRKELYNVSYPFNVFIDVRKYNDAVKSLEIIHDICVNDEWVKTKDIYICVKKIEDALYRC